MQRLVWRILVVVLILHRNTLEAGLKSLHIGPVYSILKEGMCGRYNGRVPSMSLAMSSTCKAERKLGLNKTLVAEWIRASYGLHLILSACVT